jgi:hypothetical protein
MTQILEKTTWFQKGRMEKEDDRGEQITFFIKQGPCDTRSLQTINFTL